MLNLRKISSTLSLSYKLTIPVILLVALIIIANLIQKKNALYDSYKSESIKTIESLHTVINNKIESSSQQALMMATVFSNSPAIKSAYKKYYNTLNIDSSSKIIEENIDPIIQNINKATKVYPKVHFHLPPARSFIRCWTDKRGDDLSAFRKTITEISNTHKPIKGIEIGRGGFAIRGISPIFNNQNEYLGSVEVFFTFSDIFKNIIKKDNEGYGIYLRQDKLPIVTKIGNSINEIDNLGETEGNYVLIQKSNNYSSKELTTNDFIYSDNKTKYKLIDGFIYAFIPIQDFSGENIGLVTMQINTLEETTLTQSTLQKFIIAALIVLLTVSTVLILLIKNVVSKPIKQLAKNMREISTGKLIDEVKIKSKDEIGLIYKAFNLLLKRLENSTKFANKIGEGDLDVEIGDINNEDVLSHALINMRDNLRRAKVEERKRKKEDKQRNWATEGHAKFGEILRQNNNNIKEFSINILRNLIIYTNSNQGGLFILNDNDKENPILELVASYAYDRQKYSNKEIKIGDGLVGTCAIEKQTIYMTDVPDNYVNITSGLGASNPRNILIVPLKVEENLFGVIELASFRLYEKYEIEFIEKLAESIASSLSSTKINIVTAELLEQSQQQQEEMSAQEEELRQNMEEMQVTQEDMSFAKKEAEKAKAVLDKTPNTIFSIDTDFNITYINNEGLKFSNKTIEYALESKCFDLFRNKECNTPHCKAAMAMKNKTKKVGKTILEINKAEIIYSGTPIFDDDKNIVGALEEIINISEIEEFIK